LDFSGEFLVLALGCQAGIVRELSGLLFRLTFQLMELALDLIVRARFHVFSPVLFWSSYTPAVGNPVPNLQARAVLGSASGSARSQIFGGMEPVFLRRSLWTAPGLPVFIGEGFDIGTSEGSHAVSDRGSNRSMLMRLGGVFNSLPGMLVSRQVILFSLLLAGEMGVRRAIV
jgi:hypothetical protein